jgi:fructose/tagatose bisphosphate aldolase
MSSSATFSDTNSVDSTFPLKMGNKMNIDFDEIVAVLMSLYEQPALGAALGEVETIRTYHSYMQLVVAESNDPNVAVLRHAQKRAAQWEGFSLSQLQASFEREISAMDVNTELTTAILDRILKILTHSLNENHQELVTRSTIAEVNRLLQCGNCELARMILANLIDRS